MERVWMKRRAPLGGVSTDGGQALILAVGFLMFVGLVTSAIAVFVTTSVQGRSTLDSVRGRQYAAEAAVDYAVAQVRSQGENAGLGVCDAANARAYLVAPAVNGQTMRVDCTNAIGTLLIGGKVFIQRNMIFAACVNTGSACGSNVLLRAQINFQVPAGATEATRTYVQAWSVNK